MKKDLTINWVGQRPSGSCHVHRYVSLHRAIQILESRQLPFISPRKWWDPVEEFWATQQYARESNVRKKSAFGSCWTIGPRNDALWQIYAKSAPAVRLRSSIATLEHVFRSASELSKGKIFAGQVRYLKDKELWQEASSLKTATAAKDVSRCLARGLMLKRLAFNFEQELRFIWIKSGRSRKESVSIRIECPVIFNQIRIDPRLDEAVATSIASILSRISGIHDCKQSSLREWKHAPSE